MASSVRFPIGALAVALACSGCCNTKALEERKALAKACNAEAVAGSKAFVPGPGKHPAVALQHSNNRYGRRYVSTSRMAVGKGLADTELVLCLDEPAETEIERCYFDEQLKVGFVPVPGTRVPGPNFPRVEVSQHMRLMVASTGVMLAETTLSGFGPARCNDPILGRPSDANFRGQAPSDYDISMWLEPYTLGKAP